MFEIDAHRAEAFGRRRQCNRVFCTARLPGDCGPAILDRSSGYQSDAIRPSPLEHERLSRGLASSY